MWRQQPEITDVEILSEEKVAPHIVLRDERMYSTNPDINDLTMESYYNEDGVFIDCVPSGLVQVLIEYEVEPIPRDPGHHMCSIGFSKKNQKWYGWSHRGMFGFGVGHKVTVEEAERLGVEVDSVAETLDDCRTLAIQYAEMAS